MKYLEMRKYNVPNKLRVVLVPGKSNYVKLEHWEVVAYFTAA